MCRGESRYARPLSIPLEIRFNKGAIVQGTPIDEMLSAHVPAANRMRNFGRTVTTVLLSPKVPGKAQNEQGHKIDRH